MIENRINRIYLNKSGRSHLLILILIIILLSLKVPTMRVHGRRRIVRWITHPSRRTQRTVIIRRTTLQRWIVRTTTPRILIQITRTTNLTWRWSRWMLVVVRWVVVEGTLSLPIHQGSSVRIVDERSLLRWQGRCRWEILHLMLTELTLRVAICGSFPSRTV